MHRRCRCRCNYHYPAAKVIEAGASDISDTNIDPDNAFRNIAKLEAASEAVAT